MQHAVTPDESGKRVDVIVAQLTGFSRSLVAQAVKAGAVRIDGTPVKGSHVLEEGETLEFHVRDRVPIPVEAEEIDLSIVYEDDDILVVDKAAGMVTHPAHGATSGTLVNALLGHVRNLPGASERPGLVHRLDRDTSGLLVVAKTQGALSSLGKAMKARRITREYLGLVTGIVQQPRGTVEGAIGRDPQNRLKYAITADGKPAVTHYEVREKLVGAAELLFRLETGRTHQIRVHMAAFGHPLVNDPIYGRSDSRLPLPGQALHAWRLTFNHPADGRIVEFQCDPPPEYTDAKAMLARKLP
ncbi:MAG: RluA family pseudouridine synthase [Candidatus Eremiobacteraeota bacterium]|nr:RluA family pseudouridine synthase [Candidatus Eremiobacteraeota bacterium]